MNVIWEVMLRYFTFCLVAALLLAANASGQFTIPATFTTPPDQMNEYTTSLLNGINPQTEYQADQQSTSHYATEAFAAGAAVPPGATVIGINAVSGYVNSNCNSSSRTVCNAVALYGSARATANNSAVWGFNPTAIDTVGTSGTNIIGGEIDHGIYGSPGFVRGLSILHGGSGSEPAGEASIGLEIQNGVGNTAASYAIGLEIGTLRSATATATYFPSPFALRANIWNGSTSIVDEVFYTATGGTGANPVMNYMWYHPYGTTNSTNWGPKNPLNLALFTTANNSRVFVLDNPSSSHNRTISVPDGNAALTMPASLSTTASTMDTVTITGMTAAGHCTLSATNASAAANFSTSYISAKTAGQITITHSALSGMTFDILCSST